MKKPLILLALIICLGLQGCSKEAGKVESEAKVKNNVTKITAGDTISNDNIEIAINKVELTKDVLPDKGSEIDAPYSAEPDHVFIHIDADIKNLQKQEIACDNIMDVEADYNDGFSYTAFSLPEDEQYGFDYFDKAVITPLGTMGVRYLIDCPEEVAETDKPLLITFTLNKKEYVYTVR